MFEQASECYTRVVPDSEVDLLFSGVKVMVDRERQHMRPLGAHQEVR